MTADNQSTGFIIDKRINIATITSVLGSFAVVVAMFVNLQTRVEFLECQVERNNSLKVEMAQVKTEVQGIRDDLAEIKQDVKAAIRAARQ